jgi:lysophospholipid acyltransferase (LPLAT)-like uncharacterized protein
MEYSSCWRLKSWDRFCVPRPFAKVRFILGPVVHVTQTTDAEQFESERGRLQGVMMSLVEQN